MNPFEYEDHDLDVAIASVFNELATMQVDGDSYQKATNQLNKLYALKHEQIRIELEYQIHADKQTLAQQEQDHQYDQDNLPWHKRLDPNAVLAVAGNIFIGLAVIKYEQTGVISSQVRHFIRKI